MPTSVYRLNLSRHLPMREAKKILKQLHELGVEGIYCSPYFLAHSDHGYDILDPTRLNHHVATKQGFVSFCKELKKLGMYHLLDLVPNHMGVYPGNKWLWDVKKKGKKSRYAKFFDIDWERGDGQLKLLPELINYRRFFNIFELIGVRIEDPEVMEAHHKWIYELIEAGVVDGVRIDHPDGLYDPASYFKRLRKKHSGLIVVEKILAKNEELPLDWDVDGTVGYKFLNLLTGLFIDPEGEETITRLYGKSLPFQKILQEKKLLFIKNEMMGDIIGLADKLHIALEGEYGSEELQEALIKIYCLLPIYRTYIGPKTRRLSDHDRPIFEALFKKLPKTPVFKALKTVFFLQRKGSKLRDFILRFQQLAAPIMAKGEEDIAFYHYNRFLCLNEVGGDPTIFGKEPSEFHQYLKKHRTGLLPSSTHDTKRSEDARLQLAALSERPDLWEQFLENVPKRDTFLYQLLLAIWPEKPSFNRLLIVYIKSLREMRERTDWQEPDFDFEKRAEQYLHNLLNDQTFLKHFEILQKQIQPLGMWNALSATVLKMGAPGIIDIYQGTENWSFTLVDPDNRRSIDFALCKPPKGPPKKSWFDRPETGHLKLYLHKVLLNARKEHKDLFLHGQYLPMTFKSPLLIGYRRKKGDKECLVLTRRFFSKKLPRNIPIPSSAGTWKDLITGKIFEGPLKSDCLEEMCPFLFLIKQS